MLDFIFVIGFFAFYFFMVFDIINHINKKHK